MVLDCFNIPLLPYRAPHGAKGVAAAGSSHMASLRVAQPQLGLVLLILAFSLPCASCRPPPDCSNCKQLRGLPEAGGGTAYVANASDPAAADIRVPTVTLKQALADPNVSKIVLLTNYSVGKGFLQRHACSAAVSMLASAAQYAARQHTTAPQRLCACLKCVCAVKSMLEQHRSASRDS